MGSLLLVAGMGALIWTVDRYGGAVHSWQLLPALLVCGLGLGCVIAPLVNVILAGIIEARTPAPPRACSRPSSRSAGRSAWR